MKFLELTVLSAIIFLSNFGKCKDLTTIQMKESDIIKITVENKQTTDSLSGIDTVSMTQTPMTILPFKIKPERHTLPVVNMIEPSNKPSGKVPSEKTSTDMSPPRTSATTEQFQTFQTPNSVTESIKLVEFDLEANEDSKYSNTDLELLGDSSVDFVTDESLNPAATNDSSTPNETYPDYERVQNSTLEYETIVPSEITTENFASNASNANLNDYQQLCERSGNGRLQYVWGDAFSNRDCLGPNMQKYPTEIVDRMFQDKWKRLRQKRETKTEDPIFMRHQLINGWLNANRDLHQNNRMMKSSINEIDDNQKCPGKVKKLCQSDYNTTAPIFGMSMTTGQPVAIVQKFPDLLQQVIYEVCLSDECAVVHGKCANAYIPYLFLTIPLGPVTLTGQDYILVESGCSCKPDP